jgi:hypothetical protein
VTWEIPREGSSMFVIGYLPEVVDIWAFWEAMDEIK